MTIKLKNLLAIVFLSCPILAFSGVNSSDCEKQFRKLLNTSVSCALEVRSEALKDIVSFTGGMVKDASCRIPLIFEKSDIYGKWIKRESLNLPKLQVQCLLTSANAEVLAVNSYIQPACSRTKGKDWACNINMSGTQGMGVLGAMLETQVNNSDALKADMKQFLSSMGE